MFLATLISPVFGALLGLATASFLSCAADRKVSGESLNGRSHCVCGRTLSPLALIPMLGWVSSWGKARCCHSRIPARYPLSEVALAATWAGSAGVFAWPAALAVWVGSGAVLWWVMYRIARREDTDTVTA